MRYFKELFVILLYALKYLAILLLVVLILVSIALYNVYGDFHQATLNAIAGKNSLNAAVLASQNRNWEEALLKSHEAKESFDRAMTNIDDSRANLVIRNQRILRNQVNDVEYLLKTAQIISKSLEHTIPLVEEIDKIISGNAAHDFSSLSDYEKAQFISLIYESEPELNGLQANLKLALLNLEKIHRLGVLLPVYSKINEFKYQLNEANALMEQIAQLPQLLPALSGYPETSRFLILLQNNHELRPSGGFIGLYGILETKNGKITHLSTSDSYHLDMPAVGAWEKEPPAAIKKYMGVENWYLRDANWSPDWPTSAQQVTEIYKGEKRAIGQNPESFTGVIAINPDFVADLIKLVGPITVNDEVYTAENFQELLQYNVEVAYREQDIASWDRKEIINDLVSELRGKLFALPATRWQDVLKTINNNINNKNIQAYFFDPNLQTLVKNLGASGEVRRGGGDYLMIVDANLAAFKSDAVMDKNVSYSLHREGSDVVVTVQLNYDHEGSFDWRTTRYRSYTRIYAPLNSKLISINGLSKNNPDFTVMNDSGLNKTVIGFFWSIEPGATKEVVVKYILPKKIVTAIDVGNYYDLYLQKQSGNDINITLNLDLSNNYHFDWSDELSRDSFFQLDLESN